MRKAFLILLACTSVSLGLIPARTYSQEQPKQPPATRKAAIDKANALLMNARLHVQAEDYTTAEKLILEAASAAPDDPEIRKAAESDLKGVLEKAKEKKSEDDKKTKSKQLAQLQEAERLLSEGKFDKAADTVQSVLKETSDTEVILKAKEVADKIHPFQYGLLNNALQRLYVIGGWVIDFLLVILFIFLGYWLVRLIRYLWALFKRKKWLILEITDSSGGDVGEMVIDSLRQLSMQKSVSVSTGLLALERPQFPSVVHLQLPQVEVDPAPALDALNLQIGTINVGTFAKALLAFRKWINARRSHIAGRVISSTTQVTVHLTRRNAGGKTNLVSASCDIATGVDAGSVAAKAASYKMYYLIAKEQTAKEASVAEAEAAQKLSEGLEMLRRYIYDQYTEGRQKAYEVFSRIRSEQPTLRVAYLYEGVALDLMERHDEAITRFNYLAESDSEEQLKAKAIYNKGISLFRKYMPESLEEAIEVFQELIGQEQNLADHPIKSLALAAKANAIAHRPIFWQEIIFKDQARDGADLVFKDRSRDDAEIHKLKEDAKTKIDGWIKEVEDIAKKLEDVYKASKNNKAWDAISSEQLNWAIFNARGNVYLNCANNFYVRPYVDDQQEPKLREEYLKKAFDYFQRCQLILPAGVETLTNLATVLLSLSRTADARTYADAAIKLNPDYEYAYYRKAQSLDQENRPDKVVEVLKAFAKERTPRIRRFKDLYDKYSVELART